MFDVLKSFIIEIKNHFDVTSKYLRADNALEFVQSSVQFYCAFLDMYIRLLALTPLNKMVLLSTNTDIFWMSLALSCYI